MEQIGVISDTHGFIDDKIINFLTPCDQVWHAGDIGSVELLVKLEAFKPLKAVYGNIDDHKIRQSIPEIQRFSCEGKNILMVHIGGYPGRYERKVIDLFNAGIPDIFICGHSHILKVIADKKHDLLHINPGAAGVSGFHKFRTAIRFKIHKGNLSDMEILELPR